LLHALKSIACFFQVDSNPFSEWWAHGFEKSMPVRRVRQGRFQSLQNLEFLQIMIHFMPQLSRRDLKDMTPVPVIYFCWIEFEHFK